jgi:hypothetical protein
MTYPVDQRGRGAEHGKPQFLKLFLDKSEKIGIFAQPGPPRPSSRGGRQVERGVALRSGAAGKAEIGTTPGIGRWSAGRRRPLRHWGRASRVAGPAGHARGARAGSFAKSLPGGLASLHGVSQTPGASRRSIASLRRGRKKGKRRARAVKNRAGGALRLSVQLAPASGRCAVNVAPCPSTLSIVSRPPWRLRMCLTSASPSPVPPWARLSATSTR